MQTNVNVNQPANNPRTLAIVAIMRRIEEKRKERSRKNRNRSPAKGSTS